MVKRGQEGKLEWKQNLQTLVDHGLKLMTADHIKDDYARELNQSLIFITDESKGMMVSLARILY